MLPVRLIKYWYFDSFKFFFRLWKNVIATVEEDLAVGLMWRLLFVPLFHDSSIIGRLMSFSFRLIRIGMGIFAYFIVSLIIILMLIVWLAWPVLLFAPEWRLLGLIIGGLGLIIFIVNWLSHPELTVDAISHPSQLWSATKLRSNDLKIESLLQTNDIHQLYQRLELDPQKLNQPTWPTDPQPIYQAAITIAKNNHSQYLSAGDFYLALIMNDQTLPEQLIKYKLKTADFLLAWNLIQLSRKASHGVALWDKNYQVYHLKGTNRGWMAVPTPTVNQFSIDLTHQIRSGDFSDFAGRLDQINQLLNILASNTNSNALVVGPIGVGKTTLARFLAQKIVDGNAPASLATKRIVQLDLSRLLAGVNSQGQLADRLSQFFDEVIFSQNIIVFVDDIHLLGLGEVGQQLNLFGLMLPYLESNKIQFLATSDPASYQRVIERSANFAHLFKKVDFPPATVDEALQLLIALTIKLEQKVNLKISLIALQEIVQLSSQLIHDLVLPDSALGLYQDSIEQALNQKAAWLTSNLVKQTLSISRQLPVTELASDDKQQLLNLEELIHQRFIDQTFAVTAIANTLRRSATGLRDPHRPIGSFLFVGPTGVGKTELAKVLTDLYFQQKGDFLRLDMSEYQSADSIDQLVGSEHQTGVLVEEVLHHPYSLILLDEFEKADPKILTLFLQILEDGRLTDYQGRTLDFTQTIIIATSNVAALTITQGLSQGRTLDQIKPQIEQEVLQVFKPELINRFDQIVLFQPLAEADLKQIVRLKLADLKANLLQQGYPVEFSEELISELAKRGVDPVLGARPLRRLIQDTLEARLSTKILEGKLVPGDKITIDQSYLD